MKTLVAIIKLMVTVLAAIVKLIVKAVVSVYKMIKGDTAPAFQQFDAEHPQFKRGLKKVSDWVAAFVQRVRDARQQAHQAREEAAASVGAEQ